MSEFEIRAMQGPWNSCVELLVTHGNSYVSDVTMKTMDTEEYINPAFKLKPAAAQTLMDDLWVAGFRPTEGTGSAGQLAATQRHLEDMRSLIFNRVKQSDT